MREPRRTEGLRPPAAPEAGEREGVARELARERTPPAPRVVLAFLPIVEAKPKDVTSAPPTILDVLAARPELALGLSSAMQGGYDQQQAFVDITQGTRTSSAAYTPRIGTRLALILHWKGPSSSNRGPFEQKNNPIRFCFLYFTRRGSLPGRRKYKEGRPPRGSYGRRKTSG